MTGSVSAVACMRLLDCGSSLAHLPRPASRVLAFHPRHASRYRLASRSGHARWLVTFQLYALAIRRGLAFNWQRAIPLQQSNAGANRRAFNVKDERLADCASG